jgi:hypothetical protein
MAKLSSTRQNFDEDTNRRRRAQIKSNKMAEDTALSRAPRSHMHYQRSSKIHATFNIKL